MKLRTLFRRREPPLPAPAPPETSSRSPRRRRIWRWALVLGIVTVMGVTRNQWPALAERVPQVADLPAWFEAVNVQDRWTDMMDFLRSDLLTQGNREEEAPGNSGLSPAAANETDASGEGQSVAQATPTATPTPEPVVTPTPIPWTLGTQVYATAATEYTFLWMEPGTATANLIAERYESGAAFEIIDPGRAYNSYPVVINGVEWWRLQAADGLVGWIAGTQLTTDQLMQG